MAALTRRLGTVAIAAFLAGILSGQAPSEPPSFKGKTVTMIVAYAAGGGTDLTGRLLAPYLTRYLPGNPAVVVQNMPGGSGTRAMNYLVQRTALDGLTVLMAAGSAVDPDLYRTLDVAYNPRDYNVIGGFGRGGLALLVRTAAEPRLRDRAQPPLSIGGVTAHDVFSRSGMALFGIKYLGWNARWVVGYAGTNEIMLALDRGEVDMAVDGTVAKIRALVDSRRARILAQSSPRADFPDAPLFMDEMAGKIADPVGQKAFAYWRDFNEMDKWLGLSPGTPEAIVAAYRTAFDRAARDREFIDQGKKVSEDFVVQPAATVSGLVQTLAATPPEAIDRIKQIAREQGLEVK
jgi:tripartite-type tricarboxylate transporter receptor subunit TctC